MSKFSFKKPGSAGAEPTATTPTPAATVVDTAVPEAAKAVQPGQASTQSPQNLPATVAPAQPPAFYTGDDDMPSDPQDIRLPRLNIIQKSSQSDWLKHGVGSLLLKGSIVIPKPATVVVAGIRPKVWIEKTKFGSTVKARMARSIDEVAKLGGTDLWKFSKENPSAGSDRPWFMPSVTALLLIQKPDSLPEDSFGYEADGKVYAAALFTCKSTNFDAFFVTVNSERRGLLSEGFSSRFLSLDVVMKQFSGGESGVCRVNFGDKTPAAVRELAHKLTVG